MTTVNDMIETIAPHRIIVDDTNEKVKYNIRATMFVQDERWKHFES